MEFTEAGDGCVVSKVIESGQENKTTPRSNQTPALVDFTIHSDDPWWILRC